VHEKEPVTLKRTMIVNPFLPALETDHEVGPERRSEGSYIKIKIKNYENFKY